MNKNKYLLLASSLGCLALLVVAAAQENVFKAWRRVQRASRTEAGPVEVRLRQVVVPGLRAADRCVSCHVGMAPGESGVSGPRVVAAHKQVAHDPADYGCTVCHGGQGSATEQAGAHGEAPFWPEPMIPAKYAYAGCGSCHTHVRVPNESALARGRNQFERLDCLACHKVEGRGGTLRVGGVGGMEGPDLSRVGAAGYDPRWYEAHRAASDLASSGVWKNSFGAIDEAALSDLSVFLDSRVGAPGLVEAKALFHSLGCRGCHKVNGVGGDDGPDLTRVGEKDPGRTDFTHVPGDPTLANWFAEHFRDPAKVVPGSAMPALGLSEPQVDALTFYMLSLRHSDFPEAYWPKDRIRAERFGVREFATDGATLYGTFCAACHGLRGEGRRYPGMPVFPAVGNPDFIAVATDEFLLQTVTHGRSGRRMPAWGVKEGGLRPEEILAVAGHLRVLGGGVAPEPDATPVRWVKADARAGERLYLAYCAGCHGPVGAGGEGLALNNPNLLAVATDTYLVQTISRGRRGTAMEGFAKPSTVHPALAPADIEAIVSHIRSWEKKP
jgi:mono/diheme cytochrome c family protein